MTMTVLGNRDAADSHVEVKIAPGDAIDRVADVEADFSGVGGQDEIRDTEGAFRAAYMRPLLHFGNEGAVEPRRDAAIEQQFAGKFRGHKARAVLASLLGEQPAGDAAGELKVH